MTTATALNELKQRRTEWAPWLAVVEEVLRETDTSEWESAFSPAAQLNVAQSANANPQQRAVSLLAGMAVGVRSRSVRRFLKHLIGVAVASGAPKMATLDSVRDSDLDVLALFKGSLTQDTEYLGRIAVSRGADVDAFHAVVGLVCVPFLQACGRRLRGSIPASWSEGYCPLCGSWPAFVEERGIERSRYFRCGRCGGEWHARALSCPYCGVSEHDALISLIPQAGRSRGIVEACTRCSGYMKVLIRLQGCSPLAVLVEDLASVDLDLAARAAAYTRPAGAGFPLDITVSDEPGITRRLFAWNA